MKTLVILRTHRADPETLAAFDRYAGLRSADVVVCCDERSGAVDLGGRTKVGFDAKVMAKLGLFRHPACGWRCGDYAYYVTRTILPDYDFYWLVEPDVVMNTADLDGTFEALNATTADFLAPHLGPRDHRWGWYRTMHRTYPEVYGFIFPITRLSAAAIDHLHAARRDGGISLTRYALHSWPNDEAFVATELHHHSFQCKELGHNVPGCYTPHTLRTGTPWDRTQLSKEPPDGHIYHPVRHFSAWFETESKWATDYAIRRRGKYHVHFRAHIRKLVKFWFGTTEHAALHSAGLFPLMLVSRMKLEASYIDEAGRFGPYRETEARAHRPIRMLARRYHPRRSGRAYATAYFLSENVGARSDQVAALADFSWYDPEPLHEVPVTFALPYAYDFDHDVLLLTVHPLPSSVLMAASILDEQRRQACIGCQVNFRHLHRFYPIPAMLPAISFLHIGDDSMRAEALETLRSMGKRAVAEPPALAQLAHQSERFLRVRRQWRDALLWAAVGQVFVTYGASAAPIVFVVSEDILAIRGALEALLRDVAFANQVDEVAFL